jgi:hypothetical protein
MPSDANVNVWLQHVRTQHPVGQGGFHSAVVRSNSGDFRYVYDCGSSNRDALEGELAAYIRQQGNAPINLLALSHLDEDHVSGVERLLGGISVDTVLLPYLDLRERTLLISEDCERGALSKTRWDLYEQTTKWFTDRGAHQVVYVLPQGGQPPEQDEGPEDRPPLGGPEEPFHFKIGRVSRVTEQLFPLSRSDLTVRSGESLPITSGAAGRLVRYWELVPFCHPEPQRVESFFEEVKRLLPASVAEEALDANGKPDILAQLKELLRNAASRRRLADLYRLIRKDRNLSSMSLYSGPTFGRPFAYHVRRGEDQVAGGSRRNLFEDAADDRARGRIAPGWIGTGDAKLCVLVRAAAFSRHYDRVAPRIGSFVLPHHGSRHNFEARLFEDQMRPALGRGIWTEFV